jgi:2,3-bisphosphoglycerate-independent phosphoglycerate mutase
MKHVIIIADGAGDLPLAELAGKTPLEAARMPNTASLARRGRMGVACTTPPGFEAGSDVCSMSLLGYDPARYHTGRAPLEAAALGLDLTPRDWIFRLNFVTTGEQGADAGLMLDHSAGAITDIEARELVRDLVAHWQRVDPALVRDVALHPGVSYRSILVDSSGADYATLHTTPPHAIPRERWESHMPRGAGGERVARLMMLSREALAGHRVNAARRGAGKREATMAWVWGQGTKPSVPTFRERFGLRGAMITSVDLLRGIAAYIGWDRLEVAGLTSYHDTDYAAQGRATIDAIARYDIVCCHIEAPDEASHQGDWRTKVASLEAIDEKVVGPVVAALGERYSDAWRVLLLPDHYTLCSTRKHDATPVPFLMAGALQHSHGGADVRACDAFTESLAVSTGWRVAQGHELMATWLGG